MISPSVDFSPNQRQFSANFRRKCRHRECRSAFIEHTVFYRDARNNSRASSDLRGNKFYCQPAVGFSPFPHRRDVLDAWNPLTGPDAGRKLYFRPSNENVQKIVLARYRVSDIRTRTGDESGETRRVFRVKRNVGAWLSCSKDSECYLPDFDVLRTRQSWVRVNQRDTYLLNWTFWSLNVASIAHIRRNAEVSIIVIGY